MKNPSYKICHRQSVKECTLITAAAFKHKDEKKNNHIRDDAAQWTILNFYPIRIERHEFTPIQIQNEVFNMRSR